MSEDEEPPRTRLDRVVETAGAWARDDVVGAVLLLAATGLAIAWANSPWAGLYERLLDTMLVVRLGDFELAKPVLLWINDGLMGLFFFVVGLEIKRELLAGELSSGGKAALPVAAAVGGMVAPALIYAAINPSGEATRGWGIPVATDIAFSLGVLKLLGRSVPLGLRVFLTALAIVDDIGAIVVIAVFYTEGVALASLAAGGGLLAVSVAANRAGVRAPVPYFILGTLVWVAFVKSGVHATLAAVLMAMTIPASVRIDRDPLLARMRELLSRFGESPTPRDRRLLSREEQHVVARMAGVLERGTAPLQRLEHALEPIVHVIVMPAFALANAGVELGGGLVRSLAEPVSLGIVAGLFVGKQAGILGFAWLAVRLGVARLPTGVSWRQVHAVACLAGIGFTMSLFIASLAFTDATLRTAKAGVLTASLLSGVVGGVLLRRARGPASPAASDDG